MEKTAQMTSEKEISEEVEKAPETECDLCHSTLGSYATEEADGRVFCCMGCQAVYRALEAKGVDSMQEDPLFALAKQQGLLFGSQIKTKSSNQDASRNQQVLVQISGMWCEHCASLIQWLIMRLKGVVGVWVDYSCDLALIEYDPMLCGKEEILKKLHLWGWQAWIWNYEESEQKEGKEKWKLGILSALTLQVMMLSYPSYIQSFGWFIDGNLQAFNLVSYLLTIPVCVLMWPNLFRQALLSLKSRRLGMEFLVSLSSFSAFTLSILRTLHGETHLYLDSCCVLLTLVAWGYSFTSSLKRGFSKQLAVLCCNQASYVRVKDDRGRWKHLESKNLQEGAIYWAIGLDRILCDAQVLSGRAWLDRSWSNGESTLKAVEKGDLVYAGDRVQQGCIELQAIKAVHNSWHEQINMQVARELKRKSKEYTSLMENVLTFFIPFLILLALVSGAYLVFTDSAGYLSSLQRVLAILCIGCPCAVAIAEPLIDLAVIRALAKESGVIYRPWSLKHANSFDIFAFDKTGTLTEGKLIPLQEEQIPQEYMPIAVALAQNSHHPASQALCQLYKGSLPPCSRIEEVFGSGISGIIDQERWFLGSKSWIYSQGIEDAPFFKNCSTEEGGGTEVYLANSQHIVGRQVWQDRLREHARDLIQALGPGRCHLLSGDREQAVKNIAQRCKIRHYKAKMSPLDKAEYIRALKNKNARVMMVGDGLNDSPAMAQADFSIALSHEQLPSLGAFFAADMYLPAQKLPLITKIIALNKKCVSANQMNIVWAFFYNAIGLFLAVSGYLSPTWSALAMWLSSLAILLNTNRILRFKM